MAYLDLRDLAKELADLVDREEDEDDQLDEGDTARLTELHSLETELDTDDLDTYAREESAMIPDHDFEDYAREFAYDVEYIKRDSHMDMYVDWEKWANDLKADYREVDFDGYTYQIRAY